MLIKMLDGRVTSHGPTAVGAVIEVDESEARYLISERWAEVAVPAVENTAGVQPARPGRVPPPVKPTETPAEVPAEPTQTKRRGRE